MKKTLIIVATLFISLIIAPQYVLAAWWNPLSWFSGDTPVMIDDTTTKGDQPLPVDQLFQTKDTKTNNQGTPKQALTNTVQPIPTTDTSALVEQIKQLQEQNLQLKYSLSVYEDWRKNALLPVLDELKTNFNQCLAESSGMRDAATQLITKIETLQKGSNYTLKPAPTYPLLSVPTAPQKTIIRCINTSTTTVTSATLNCFMQ